jgi:hypothetical protein
MYSLGSPQADFLIRLSVCASSLNCEDNAES